MRAGVWREFVIDMGFRSTEKCPKEQNLITILNYQLGHKISVVFIDNHHLVLHTHILPCKFWEWFDDKLMKLGIKQGSKLIGSSAWIFLQCSITSRVIETFEAASQRLPRKR